MSNRDDIKAKASSLVSGFIAPQIEDTKPTKKEDTKVKSTPKASQIVNNDSVDDNKIKYKNGVNLNDNYTITFKIDADIEDFLKNIEKIAFLESIKSGKINGTTRTEFVNKLIRDEFYKVIGASDDDIPSDIKDKWLKYKIKNNL